VQATGHHTGAPLVMPGLEPLNPSGKHFCLGEEVQKVRVAGGKVAEIQVMMTHRERHGFPFCHSRWNDT
jgi:hypothetical protein